MLAAPPQKNFKLEVFLDCFSVQFRDKIAAEMTCQVTLHSYKLMSFNPLGPKTTSHQCVACNARFRAVAYLAFTSKKFTKTRPFSIRFFRIASQINIFSLSRTYGRVFRVNLSNTVYRSKCASIKSSRQLTFACKMYLQACIGYKPLLTVTSFST